MSLTKFQLYIKDKNLKQAKIARDTKIDPSALNLFAKGRHNWNRRILQKLVVYFDCSPAELVDWEKWIEQAKNKKNGESPPVPPPESDHSQTDIEEKT